MAGTQAGHAGQGVEAGQEKGAVAGLASGAGWSGRDCVGVQADSVTPSRIAALPTTLAEIRSMWVIFLEMGVALGLLLLIVWWTWPKKRPQDKDSPEDRQR